MHSADGRAEEGPGVAAGQAADSGARHRARRVMAACLGGFVAGVLACLAVNPPSVVTASHGLSYYGTTTSTLPFYGVALLAVAVAAWAASIAIGRPVWWRYVLRGISGGAPLVLLTPFTMSTTVNVVHDVIAGLVFFGQFLITVTALRRRSLPIRLCALVVGIGDALAVHALFVATADMLLAQLISLTGFLPLLTVWAWLPEAAQRPEPKRP